LLGPSVLCGGGGKNLTIKKGKLGKERVWSGGPNGGDKELANSLRGLLGRGEGASGQTLENFAGGAKDALKRNERETLNDQFTSDIQLGWKISSFPEWTRAHGDWRALEWQR